MNFDETKIKSKSYQSSNDEVQYFCNIIVVIEERMIFWYKFN